MGDDPADERVKTVYAHFGLAMYLARCLEHGLVNALVYLDLIPSKPKVEKPKGEWQALFDSFMEQHFKHTLGQMIRDLAEVTTVSPTLEGKLADALKTRNWLAHYYFRERAEEFMSSVGQNTMIAELERAQGVFQEADEQLSATVKPVREKYGFTDERLEQAYRQMLSGIKHDL